MRYHDDTLYWHYYNEDRERIDYYGSILANSQGTFAVSIILGALIIERLGHIDVGLRALAHPQRRGIWLISTARS